jgi:NUMOD4 motif
MTELVNPRNGHSYEGDGWAKCCGPCAIFWDTAEGYALLQRKGTTEWRTVPGWHAYEVSDDDLAQVRSVPRRLSDGRRCGGTVLKQSFDRKRYRYVTLADGKRQQRVPVHKLVMAAFAGERPAGMEILHEGDEHVTRNGLRYLRYGSKDENRRDRYGDRNRNLGPERWSWVRNIMKGKVR